jgi:hypothetical protein
MIIKLSAAKLQANKDQLFRFAAKRACYTARYTALGMAFFIYLSQEIDKAHNSVCI